MSVLNKLTEGIVNRDLRQEGDALLSKWEKTGLLEGLDNDSSKNGMARLLENQAKQLLKEASSMAAGDVEGFASVAFPLVRRVFGGLLANDLVSVQPMSLPSGLIFFLDFTYSDTRLGLADGESVYGGGVVAKGIQTGVTDVKETGGGFYNLQAGYSAPTASALVAVAAGSTISAAKLVSAFNEADKKAVRFDPDLLDSTTHQVREITFTVTGGVLAQINKDMTTDYNLTLGTANDRVVRRLTSIDGNTVTMVLASSDGTVGQAVPAQIELNFPIADKFDNGGATPGSVVGADTWGLEEATNAAQTGAASGAGPKDVIPEIDIKVDSIAVTAQTRKLKAKWSPELGQDLNAYHNLDAEVELTSILS